MNLVLSMLCALRHRYDVMRIGLLSDINHLAMVTLGWANTGLLNYCQMNTRGNGSEFVIGHIDGTLELRGVLSAEGWWLAMGPGNASW
jgi:hypothetical protein